jgi:RNA polymerase sigma-70 factor (ECF subfamily)
MESLVTADDGALVRHCLTGDERALRAFVERFQGIIFGVCYRMLNHREDAEDVSQEVFLRIFRNLDKWDPARPLKPWLLTITTNRCRTFLEKRSRQTPTSDLIADLAVQSGEKNLGDLADELQLALERLREEYRTCFILFYQAQVSCAEIGEIMGCPRGTVKTWLHRARLELADHLQRRGVVPDVHYQLH